MRGTFLVWLLLAAICCADERRSLLIATTPVIATFFPADSKEIDDRPTTSHSSAVKKLAVEWTQERATVRQWKSSGFAYAGELHGRPADELKPGKYAVYRMTFRNPPHIGGEIQTDLLFYAQGKELLWPPEEWPANKTPPGQMVAVVREGITNK